MTVTNGTDVRSICLSLLVDILENETFSHIALKNSLAKHQDLTKQERSFLTKLVNGTIERKITLDYIIESYSSVKVKKMKPLIRNLLRMSVYQLKYMDQVPASAVCNEAVKIVKKRGVSGLSGFVNGILRNIVRDTKKISFPDPKQKPIQYLSIQYSVPEWLVSFYLEQYDFATVENLLQAFLKDQKTSIRCNQNQVTPDQLKKLLMDEGVTVEDGPYLEDSFFISNYDHLNALDSFQKGYFFIQDPSSMLVGTVAGVKKQDFVIDVCAAPGGKSLHIASILQKMNSDAKESQLQENSVNSESSNNKVSSSNTKSSDKNIAYEGKVLSRDLTEGKVALIEENRKRLRIENLIPQVHDALKFDEAMVGQADLVIADLPCSGLGVIGKKPEIKYRVKPEDLEELSKLQREILNRVHQYVKNDGTLIYSTCTINPKENEDNLRYIMEELGFELESLDSYLPTKLHSPTTKEGYLQLLPGIHESDGFFIARLKRKTLLERH